PHVAQTEPVVEEVVIEVLTAPGLGPQFDVAAVVLAHAEGAAAFDATEDGDATGCQAALTRDLQGGRFLVDVWTVEIVNVVAVGLGHGFAAADEGSGESFGMSGVLLEEQIVLEEIAVDAAGITEQATAAAEAEPIESGKNSDDQ